MSLPRSESPLSRSVATVLGLGGFLVVVVVGVFLYVKALSGSAAPGLAAGSQVAPVRYVDRDTGYRLLAPAGWSATEIERADGEEDRVVRTVFRDPRSAARLTVSVDRGWRGGTPSRAWVEREAPGTRSIDGRWPTDATVGGAPALIVWSDESPEAPARYAAFVAVEGSLYRVSYSAADGGAALDAFARALVSLEWTDDDTVDTVPPLPTPRGVLYPLAEPGGA